MKATFLLAAAVLGGASLLYAQAPDSSPITQSSEAQPSLIRSGAHPLMWNAGSWIIRLMFPQPVVDAERVGTPESGCVRLSDGLGYRAVWQSRSELVVTTNEVPPLQKRTLTLDPNWRGPDGKCFELAPITIGGSGEPVLRCEKEAGMGKPVFLYTTEADREIVSQVIGNIYCETDEQPSRKLPVKIRPATRADVLQHWDFLKKEVEGLEDDDLASFQEGSPTDPLPGIWYAELPEDVTRTCQLVIPHAGYFDQEKGDFKDWSQQIYHCTGKCFTLNNKRLAPCSYEVNLHAFPGLDFQDPLATLSQLQWFVQEWKHSKDRVKMSFREGAFRCSIRGKELTLTPDLEASQAYVHEQQQPDGRVRKLCTRVVWKMNNGNRHVLLTLGKDGSVITGKAPMADGTTIAPRQPALTATATFGSLTPGREREPMLSCMAYHADRLRVRAWQLDSSAEQAVRALRAYRTYYPGGKLLEPTGESDAARFARLQHAETIVPTDLLPGVQGKAEKELFLTKNCGQVGLRELFPQAGRYGLYFVEFEAQKANDGGIDDQEGKALTQGLVQMTNIGLMWKCWQGRVFVYAYTLTDGKALDGGVLRLLDAEGKTISEHAVQDGTVELPLSQIPAYLQVACGEDRFLTEFAAREYEDYQAQASNDRYSLPYEISELLQEDEELLPQTNWCIFTDRRSYRPGETVHLRGYVRDRLGNSLRVPELTRITATIEDTMGSRQVALTPEKGGAFSMDIPVPEDGENLMLTFRAEYFGDADGSSELMQRLTSRLVNPADRERLLAMVRDSLREKRHVIRVGDFQRNDFEVEHGMKVDAEQRTVKLTGKATYFNTAPVSDGQTRWTLSYKPVNFYPEQYRDYFFGDFSKPDGEYYRAYYGIDCHTFSPNDGYISTESRLDEQGEGSQVFHVPYSNRRLQLRGSLSVHSSSHTTLYASSQGELHPASLYVGIRGGKRYVPVGERLPIHCLLVDTAGKAWQGEAIPGTISITRKNSSAYRIGHAFLGQVKKVDQREELVNEAPITLTGTPSTTPQWVMETPKPGIYEVTVQGKDSAGKTFRSVVVYHVYGDAKRNRSFWNGDVELLSDRHLYRPGETAHLLLYGAQGGEALITVEREGVLRHFRTTLDPARPVVELPLLPEDQPGVRVTAFLVQGSETSRKLNGTANILSRSLDLLVEPVDKMLQVELTPPPAALLPEETCEVSGTVRDAQGKPVAGAAVTLYAVDEGTLQVHGYSLPRPLREFFGSVRYGVNTWNSSSLLIGNGLGYYDYGNKGVFVGGGDSLYSDEDAPSDHVRIRENFTPCALWIGHLSTDDQGRFHASYRNPDTLTRYRLMAVASAGADQFGQARSSYEVNQPVMLEAQVPLAATEGDKLDLPVTLSMQPQMISGLAEGASLRFRLSAEAENGQTLETSRTVELRGNQPVTLTLPVKTPSCGATSLTWTVQPEEGQLAPEQASKLQDAVKLSFPVEPARPRLREYVNFAVEQGQSQALSSCVSLDFDAGSRIKLNFSTHSLAPLASHLHFLFSYPHGCSEQLSSALLPWLMAEELSGIPGVDLPAGSDRNALVTRTLRTLARRLISEEDDSNWLAETKRVPTSGYKYWDHSRKANDEFSPYVQLVMHQAKKRGFAIPPSVNDYTKELKAQLLAKGNPHANLLAIVPLVLEQQFTAQDLDTLLSLYPSMREDALWCAAIAAAILRDPRADTLAQRARAAHDTPEIEQQPGSSLTELYRVSAPCDVLALLYRHYSTPADTTLLRDASRMLRESGRGYLSTWQSGWNCVLLDALLDHQRALSAGALASSGAPSSAAAKKDAIHLNGQLLKPSTLLQVDETLPSDKNYTANGGTVYAFGTAEGYQAHEQADQPIDHGFITSRTYEVLQKDGTWKPTLAFRIGDVVRITIHCHYTGKDKARYVAIEDRLPSTFEAIDPKSPTQALPHSIMRRVGNTGWYASRSVSDLVFSRERVRVYVDTWKADTTVRYLARVVRSGEVTIPAAKAEMMYTPQVYGLSTPEQINVEP